MITAGLLTGALLATGALLIIYGTRRSNPRLVDAVTNLRGSTPPPPLLGEDDPTIFTGWKATLGRHTASLATRAGLTPPRSDLTLIRRSTTWYWAEKSSAALAGFTIPLALTALNAALGSPLPLILPLSASLIGGVYFWIATDTAVRKQATAARDDFTRAAVAYLQILAIHRAAGDGAMTAMTGAARVSDAWMFARIRETINHATLTATPAWQALADLGDRTGITALRDVADTMRLAGESGAGVAPTLRDRAKGMHQAIITTELDRGRDRAPLVTLSVVAIVFIVVALIAAPAVAAFLAT